MANPNICQTCGMVCRTPTEYHPYAACLMFKACHDGDTVRANLEAVRATPAPGAPGQEAAAVQAVGAWQDIATAPEGVLVIVGWRYENDTENPDRHMFDYFEEGVWVNYFSEHEHYAIAGVAKGCSEDAPYTHWMPMGPIPAALPAGAGEKTS